MRGLILISIVLTSCLWQEAHSYREFFEEELTSHFPQDSNSKRVSACYFYPKHESFDNIGVYTREVYRFPAKSIDTLINSLEESALYKVKHNDSCNLFIELYFNHDLNAANHCNSIIPLPNFWEEIIALGIEGGNYLTEDFDLYVIESDTGKYIEEKYLNDKDDLFGCEKWKNGISKGVAISSERKICIYWLEIW